MITLGDLHDATLLRINVDWRSAELACTFRVQVRGTRLVKLLGTQLTSLVCPKMSPWGQSVSVNEISVCDAESGRALKIEMQSGDVIEARVGDVVITSERE